ncbi:Fimbrial assembly family protein [Methylobacterium sp. 4-46]|uniref:hypothetical protein n=1 Tax=unclassified Methylobacterium TaxID=2615210 RepID=UPI000152CDE0|nr:MULTISPECIES: hypothetical protein [Methylobacterium]ACA15697.1 Fimbrial assembly family protein [Methylobacterium sp. 4-46]WFT81434.1 hypothetical protein QA634_05965 [Methylobacterium nodulans]
MRAPHGFQALAASPLWPRWLPRAGWWLAEAASLFGEEERRDRAESDLVLRLEPGGDLVLLDRRGAEPRSYRLAPDLGDLAERLAAIRGAGRAAVRVKVLVPPDLCFLRTLSLPAGALPRMREVLDRELEAATPFRAAAIYGDWFVIGEEAGRLRIRHCVVKRSRLDPLLGALAAAGLAAGPVVVGLEEDRTLPVDLLSGGRRALPRRLAGLRAGDALALALAAGLLIAAHGLWRGHQAATLAALDAATLAARRAAPARPPAPVPAVAAELLAQRAARPPLAAIWDALAEALPGSVSAETLHLDAGGLTLGLRAPDAAPALRALARVPAFGPARLLAEDGAGRAVLAVPLRGTVPPRGAPPPRPAEPPR